MAERDYGDQAEPSAARVRETLEELEDGGRGMAPWLAALVGGIAALWSLFQLWIASPLPFALGFGIIVDVPARGVHLAFGLVLCFLLFPLSGPVPARERWPRHPHENFYWLHEDYIKDKQQGKAWHWSIWRPQLIFGEAIGSNLNVITPLGVYAALLKEQGQPLSYPGGAPYVFEAIDVDVLARALAWAAEADASHNEIFNITNGDVYVWENVWPVLAEAFGMEVGPPQPCSMVEELPKRQDEWAAIVEKYNLTAPADVREFVGESAALADFSLAYGRNEPPPSMLVSTIKLRQAGFHECMDTEDMFRKWIKRFQELRWLPPLGV